jgi:hypothetical protein
MVNAFARSYIYYIRTGPMPPARSVFAADGPLQTGPLSDVILLSMFLRSFATLSVHLFIAPRPIRRRVHLHVLRRAVKLMAFEILVPGQRIDMTSFRISFLPQLTLRSPSSPSRRPARTHQDVAGPAGLPAVAFSTPRPLPNNPPWINDCTAVSWQFTYKSYIVQP